MSTARATRRHAGTPIGGAPSERGDELPLRGGDMGNLSFGESCASDERRCANPARCDDGDCSAFVKVLSDDLRTAVVPASSCSGVFRSLSWGGAEMFGGEIG